MDCSPPGSSVHGILQARVLEWVAISFSRGEASWPRELTWVSCIAGRPFTNWATGEAQHTEGWIIKARAGGTVPRVTQRPPGWGVHTRLCLLTWTALDMVPAGCQSEAPFLLADSILPVTQYDIIHIDVIKAGRVLGLVATAQAGSTPVTGRVPVSSSQHVVQHGVVPWKTTIPLGQSDPPRMWLPCLIRNLHPTALTPCPSRTPLVAFSQVGPREDLPALMAYDTSIPVRASSLHNHNFHFKVSLSWHHPRKIP